MCNLIIGMLERQVLRPLNIPTGGRERKVKNRLHHFKSFWIIMILKLSVVVQRINDKLPKSLITKLAKEVHRVLTIQPSDRGGKSFWLFLMLSTSILH